MKITASFPTMDDAENCARRLKHTCGGINAIRIRYHSVNDPDPSRDGEPVPMAFSGGDTPGGMDTMNSVTGTPYAALFALELGPLKDGHESGSDGPDSRHDCVMDVDADPMYQREIESILLNEHGRRLHTSR